MRAAKNVGASSGPVQSESKAHAALKLEAASFQLKSRDEGTNMRDMFITSFRHICLSISVLLLTLLLWSPVNANTFVVTNTTDSGPGSLRQAILDANTIAGPTHGIIFNIPTSDPGFSGGIFTIKPLSELPVVIRNTTIDG